MGQGQSHENYEKGVGNANAMTSVGVAAPLQPVSGNRMTPQSHQPFVRVTRTAATPLYKQHSHPWTTRKSHLPQSDTRQQSNRTSPRKARGTARFQSKDAAPSSLKW